MKSLSRVQLLATPWTAAYEAPPSMGFSRQEYCSGVPLPSPRSQLGDCNRAREKLVIYIRTESMEEISGQNYGYILKVDSPFLLKDCK